MNEEQFGEVAWSWKSNDSDVQKATMRIVKNSTLHELIEHLEQVAPGTPWGDFRISGGVVWERQADRDVKAEREKWRAKNRARSERWERDTYLRLKAKFEGDR